MKEKKTKKNLLKVRRKTKIPVSKVFKDRSKYQRKPKHSIKEV